MLWVAKVTSSHQQLPAVASGRQVATSLGRQNWITGNPGRVITSLVITMADYDTRILRAVIVADCLVLLQVEEGLVSSELFMSVSAEHVRC